MRPALQQDAQLRGLPSSAATADPLLAAVISKLPAVSDGFPADARGKWLKLMAMAFDVAYGETGVVEIPSFIAVSASPTPGAAASPEAAAPAHPMPKRAAHAAAGFDYYIDAQGFARCDFEITQDGQRIPSGGRQVNADEIGDDEVIYDYRSPRNRDAIVWADNTMGARPGMMFGGPG